MARRALRGPRGPAGANGTNGINGTNGTNGANGATGPTGPGGTNGTNGINGTNGTNGTDRSRPVPPGLAAHRGDGFVRRGHPRAAQGGAIAPTTGGAAAGSQGGLTLICVRASVIPEAGEQVYVSASAEIGPPFTAGTEYSIQLFMCFQTAGGLVTPFSDEPTGVLKTGPLVGVSGLQELERSGFESVGPGGLTANVAYDFGLCAVQTTGSTGPAWSNLLGTSTQGQSKVVAMRLVP